MNPVRCFLPLAMLLGLASPAWADTPKPPSNTSDDVLDAVERAAFLALVTEGDRERAAGRIPEAATAYARAIKLHRDPLIAGRLGVLLIELNQPDYAVELLSDALMHADTTPAEREAFFKAHEAARQHGCWVEVIISHAGTSVTLDGDPRNRGGHSAFSMFVLAGEHELRARLDGYEDAVEKFTAKKGKKKTIRLTLKAAPSLQDTPPEKLLRVRDKAPYPLSNLDEPGPADEPKPREPIAGGIDGAQKPQKPRGSIGGGTVMVLGVASWSPAVGAVIEGRLQVHEHASLGLEGRAAWLTSGVEGGQISAMTAGGLVSACGHWRWLFGCALGHVGVINVEASSGSYQAQSYQFFKPGFGGRIGVKFLVTRSFILQGAFDAVGLARGTRIAVGQTILVDQPAAMLGAQVTGAWGF